MTVPSSAQDASCVNCNLISIQTNGNAITSISSSTTQAYFMCKAGPNNNALTAGL